MTLAPSFSHESSGISRWTGQYNMQHYHLSIYHQSNGKADATVKITKTMMCKALRDGTDQYEALLELRNTPRQDTGISPAEMMFGGRNTLSLLPSTGTKSIPSKKQVMMKRAERCLARDLKRLTPSQPVYYQCKEGRRPECRRGTVRTEHGKRSYIIDGRDGVYRRNRVHLHPTTRERSPEKSFSPASALSSYKLLEHMDTEKSQDANTLNKSQANSPTRPQQIRKEPDWFKDLRVQLLVS